MDREQKILTYKGYPVFGKQQLPYFDRLPKDFADQEACFIYLNEGSFSVRTPDSYLKFTKSQSLLAKCMNFFFETDEEQRRSSDCLEVIGIMMHQPIIEELFDYDFQKSTYRNDYNFKQVVVDKLLENFMESISLLLDNPELGDDEIVKTKLKEFVLLLSRTHNAPSQLDFLSSLFKPNEVSFKKTIHQNLYASLSLEELAALCNLSVSSFKRKFKETFEQTPQKYITDKKLEKAATLLKAGNERISDIAFDTGFDSLATFNRNFSKKYGISPSQFRLS